MRYKMVLDTQTLDGEVARGRSGSGAGSAPDDSGTENMSASTSPQQDQQPPSPLLSKHPLGLIHMLGAEFFKQGLVVPPPDSNLCMDPSRAEVARELVLAQYNANISTVSRLGLMDQLQDTGFRTFKPRGQSVYLTTLSHPSCRESARGI